MKREIGDYVQDILEVWLMRLSSLRTCRTMNLLKILKQFTLSSEP